MTENIIEKLIEADRSYHNTGHTLMTDQVYDALKDTARKSHPDHPYFEKVGSVPESAWEKADHQIPMGSLEKVNSEEEFLKWAEKFQGETFIIQPKIDGLSLSKRYEKGVFVQAITRGDGAIGEDITPNVRKMAGFKDNLNIDKIDASVRCEVILPRNDFNRINDTLDPEDQYKNCRNAASGICRRLDGKFSRYLVLMFYDLTMEMGLNEDAKIKTLSDNGFNTVPFFIGSAEKIIEIFKEFKENRDNLAYNIDGMVIKINSWEKQNELGVVNGRPKGQIAWKFDPPGASTTLNRVTWETGRTGVITPLGYVLPVEIDGSTIKNVTLHNIAEIKRLGVCIGDTVLLVKSNDIIPKIIQVLEQGKNRIPIETPTNCPVCDSLLVNNQVQLFCKNDVCQAKLFLRIMHFIKTVKIDDLGEALVDKLFEMGKVKSISDIFTLKTEDIAGIEGWGEKSAVTIIGNINKFKKMDPIIFLAAMGIPTLSDKTSADLFNKYGNIHKIKAATIEEISAIRGYSTISATSIVTGLGSFWSEIEKTLAHVGLKDINAGGVFSGMNFCFTGEMSHPRSFFQKIVTDKGGKNDSGVTKTTSYLVCNDNRGSSKSRKAEQYGVKLINEVEFMTLAGEEIIQEKPKVITESLF